MYKYPFSNKDDSFDLSVAFGFPLGMPDRLLASFLHCLNDNRTDFFDFLESSGELVAYSPVELVYLGTMAKPGSPALAFGKTLLEQSTSSSTSDTAWSHAYHSVIELLANVGYYKTAFRGSEDTKTHSFFQDSVKLLEYLLFEEEVASLEVIDSFGQELYFENPPTSLDLWADLPKDTNQGFSATITLIRGDIYHYEVVEFFCPAKTITAVAQLDIAPNTILEIIRISLEAGVPEVALSKLEDFSANNLFAQGVLQAYKEALDFGDHQDV